MGIPHLCVVLQASLQIHPLVQGLECYCLYLDELTLSMTVPLSQATIHSKHFKETFLQIGRIMTRGNTLERTYTLTLKKLFSLCKVHAVLPLGFTGELCRLDAEKIVQACGGYDLPVICASSALQLSSSRSSLAILSCRSFDWALTRGDGWVWLNDYS